MSLNLILIICAFALTLKLALVYFRKPLIALMAHHPLAAKIIAFLLCAVLGLGAMLAVYYYFAS